jgi:hypothetical protein
MAGNVRGVAGDSGRWGGISGEIWGNSGHGGRDGGGGGARPADVRGSETRSPLQDGSKMGRGGVYPLRF